MKVIYRIPTKEPFAFVELHDDFLPENEEAAIEYPKRMYLALTQAFHGGEGLEDKAYDAFIERMIKAEPNHIEEYNKMSLEQQKYVQVVKRAIKRINYQIKKTEEV